MKKTVKGVLLGGAVGSAVAAMQVSRSDLAGPPTEWDSVSGRGAEKDEETAGSESPGSTAASARLKSATAANGTGNDKARRIAIGAAEGAAIGGLVGFVFDRRTARRAQAAMAAAPLLTRLAREARPKVEAAAEVALEKAREAAELARPRVEAAAEVALEKAREAADVARERAADLRSAS
jgi:hypothetical protein